MNQPQQQPPEQPGNAFGLIGLAVMGQNLVLNVESRGWGVSVYNRTTEVMEAFIAEHPAKRLYGARTLQDFVQSLARPRKIILMVKAGAPVDAVIQQLTPLLEKGDIVIDGGNSLYTDTERRDTELADQGLRFMGVGVSGGEEGARKGPSIMPGGPASSWHEIKPIFESIAAQVDGAPCVIHIGPGGAGHYVKMVHNGIEYGDMQLICEAYAMFKAAGLSNAQMADVFDAWNGGDLQSYLIQITAVALRQTDPETGRDLVDVILDKAGQKGTGRWTVINATEQAVVVSTMNAAVEARVMSSQKAARLAIGKVLEGPAQAPKPADTPAFIAKVAQALYASKVISYAQGMDLMRTMGGKKDWQLDLGGIASIWRGGCIIRAKFLDRITDAYRQDPQLSSLMLAPFFSALLNTAQQDWRDVVASAVAQGIPVPAMAASLAYYDSMRSERLPANLLQAQRDLFGAHTYERIDKPEGEAFHTDWPEVVG